jgi:hypothetical protein
LITKQLEILESHMEDRIAPTCERGNDLISFLYGEANEAESRDFERHMRDCAVCKREFASFRNVRESVVAWRQETLGALPAFNSSVALAGKEQRPSALAAIREFFALSPAWMKGAVAFASLLFCLMAILALAHLREGTQQTVVTAPSQSSYTPQQIEALVDKRAREKAAELNATQIRKTPVTSEPTPQPRVVRAGNNPALAGNQTIKTRRPLNKAEREQLASDLRLSNKDDDDLQLLGDRINNED